MSDQRRTFMDRALRGKAGSDDPDADVAAWHDGRGEGALHEHLGMTAEEYGLWVIFPDAIALVLESRRREMPLVRMVEETLGAIRRVHPSPDDLEVRRLESWLKVHRGVGPSLQAGELASNAD